MIDPFIFSERKVIRVDEWTPDESDLIFQHTKGAIYLDVRSVLGLMMDDNINYFIMSAKRCYNNDDIRQLITHYLNYFEKFYDIDKELIMVYARLKVLIDHNPEYTKYMFIDDIFRYVLSPTIRIKIKSMNADNYYINISKSIKKSKESLLYDNNHGLILMELSLMMKFTIPLIVHFIYMRGIKDIQNFLLTVYDKMLSLFAVDIYSKFYETANSNIMRSKQNHPLWEKQDIRGINTTIHTQDAVENILICIIPKYVYNQNMANLNYRSIINNTHYKVTDIGYEMDFIPLMSSKRDAEYNSDFDKFEAYMVKRDESLYLQAITNCKKTMEQLELQYGPFDEKEIQYYADKLTDPVTYKFMLNSFQKELISNLFYKYFGDTKSINSVDRSDYIKLIIIAKRILQASNMLIMPYVLSSKIIKLVEKKAPNKDSVAMLMASPTYAKLVSKYRNDKIMLRIVSQLATISASEFEIIDYYNKEIDGKILPTADQAVLIREEFMLYVLMI